VIKVKEKVKEVDLYSAFIEVPYTQGGQVRITQCYLQTTPYLPLPRKPTTHLSTPKGWVGLGGWLRNETVYLPEGSHPSQH